MVCADRQTGRERETSYNFFGIFFLKKEPEFFQIQIIHQHFQVSIAKLDQSSIVILTSP